MANPTAPVHPDEPIPCRYAQAFDWHICVRSSGQPIQPGEVCFYEARAQLDLIGPPCVLCGECGADISWRRDSKAHWGCATEWEYSAMEAQQDEVERSFDAEASATAAAMQSHVAGTMDVAS